MVFEPVRPKKKKSEFEKLIERPAALPWGNQTTPAPQPEPDVPLRKRVVTDAETGEPIGFTDSQGNFVKASREDIENVISKQTEKFAPIEGAVTTEQAAQYQQQVRMGQQLKGQVGEFQQLGIEPTGLDVREAFTTGAVEAIPSALRMAGGAAIVGATAGVATGGVASIPLAAAGATVTFVGSISSSMISNMKSQRTDTTTAQQRVLDEGKQTMQDWVTLVESDPSNKMFYLAEYNKVSAQIQQAHRQMKLDTSLDLAKFETALPNLAEFDSFYAPGGERDALDREMEIAVQSVIPPPNYNMLELTNRRTE